LAREVDGTRGAGPAPPLDVRVTAGEQGGPRRLRFESREAPPAHCTETPAACPPSRVGAGLRAGRRPPGPEWSPERTRGLAPFPPRPPAPARACARSRRRRWKPVKAADPRQQNGAYPSVRGAPLLATGPTPPPPSSGAGLPQRLQHWEDSPYTRQHAPTNVAPISQTFPSSPSPPPTADPSGEV
jgi:hypothetical protein